MFAFLLIELIGFTIECNYFSSFRDLDQACMDAVAALLRGLPLQPEESDRGDLMEAKSQLFLKYFTLFMNLLNDCTDVSEIEKEVGARSRVGVAVGVGVGVGAVAVAASRLANLRNSTIQVGYPVANST